ncbi:MAG: Snf7 family protein [Promethearchaeia archaeon]
MGFLKDFSEKASKWLKGKENVKDGIKSATIKLRIYNKRLLRQVKKLEQTASRERKKAVKFRKEGDNQGAKTHARRFLQLKSQVRSVEKFRSNLEGLQFKLEQASAVKDVAGIFKSISTSVSNVKNQLNIPQIQDVLTDLTVDMEEIGMTQEVASESMEDVNMEMSVDDSKVDNFLQELDTEIEVEAGGNLPSPMIEDERVKDLEEELKKLKSDEI